MLTGETDDLPERRRILRDHQQMLWLNVHTSIKISVLRFLLLFLEWDVWWVTIVGEIRLLSFPSRFPFNTVEADYFRVAVGIFNTSGTVWVVTLYCCMVPAYGFIRVFIPVLIDSRIKGRKANQVGNRQFQGKATGSEAVAELNWEVKHSKKR